MRLSSPGGTRPAAADRSSASPVPPGQVPGKKPPSQHEPLREETRWAPEDEDALDRLLRSDFAARVWKFRETGSGVSLDEVPAVLSQLLDLNSAELERLTAILGFRAKDLRHPNGLLIGRITADR
ncbi:MAG TPA: hypothetical protein VEY30_10555, partial [Myxococcaceae bacterium]|nr:hypothetical protein [Myxococcaceae bacterium]